MAIDITKDKLITIEEAAKLFPARKGGGHIHVNTVKRWHTVGCRRIKLEVSVVGGTWYTTADALREFSRRLNAARGNVESDQDIISDADRAAREELIAEGFAVGD